MKQLLFAGCSLTQGVGLDLEQTDPANYCNVFSRLAFDASAINNIGQGGHSNLRIFMDTASQLLSKQYDCAFVGWTSYPRHVFYPGIERVNTRRWLIPNSPVEAYQDNGVEFSQNELTMLRDQLLLLHHAHHDILDIVRYVNILVHLAESVGTKIYFINNLCHWDQGYFEKLQDPVQVKDFTAYTKTLLGADTRQDPILIALYNQIHDEYATHGGIQEHLWLNLYDNIISNKVDIGNDNSHPGPATYTKYGTFLAQRFSELNQTPSKK
jgi:hypothetical protein